MSGNSSNFRQRRLSNINQAQVEAAGGSAAGAQGRGRRLSMSPEMGAKTEKDLPFPKEVVGTFSCHGVEPGHRQGETNAKINQDRGVVMYPFANAEGTQGKYALFCVYDGHGQNGDKVSEYTARNVANTLEALLKDGGGNALPPAEGLKKAFLDVDMALKNDRSIDADLSGTTAVVLLYEFIDGTKAKVWSANAGDSRATMQSAGSKVTDLTEDQKPNTPDEQKRIEKAGGFVSPPEEEWGGPARVWLDKNMTLPGLAMGRSIGDHVVSSVGVIAEPEVKEWEIDTSKDEMIVMASDGVWEFIESADACKVINKVKAAQKEDDATVQVTKLIETAAAKWRQEEGDYRDDITAICIKLQGIHEHHQKMVAGAGA